MTDEAVEQLLNEVRPAVQRIAQGYFHDGEMVADCLQEHALQLWKIRQELDETRNAREVCIRRMYFICLEKIRVRNRYGDRYAPLEDATEPELRQGCERASLRDLEVRRALEALPSNLWVVAWMVYAEGFMVSETARRLGLPRLLVKQRLGEATDRLKGLLKDWR